MIQLTLIEAGGKRLEITELPYLVGRTPECALVLESPRVSRKHARFERSESGLVVADLGSSNGTFVNGTRITGPTPLRTGDRVQFGDVVYTVEVPAVLAQTIVGGFSVLEALHEQARREAAAPGGSGQPEPEEIPVAEVLPLGTPSPVAPAPVVQTAPEPVVEAKPAPVPEARPAAAPEPAAEAKPVSEEKSVPAPEPVPEAKPAIGACPGCGRPLPAHSRFCEGCGRRTDGQEAAPDQTAVAPAAQAPAASAAPSASAPPPAVPIQQDPYAGIEASYRLLADRRSQGALSPQEFADQVNALRHCDDQGRWWQISPHTGKWLCYDGKAWQDGEPPRPAAPPTAAAGGPTPEGQPVAGSSVALAPGTGAGQGVVISPQMIEVVKRAMQLDPEAYRLAAEDGSWTIPGAALLAVNALLYGKIAMSGFSPVIQITYIVLYLAGFAGMAALLFHVGNRFTERRPTLLGWARALALAQLPMLANILPLVGWLLAMWGLLTGITAIRGAGGTSWGKAVLLGVVGGIIVSIPLMIVSMVVFWLFGAGAAPAYDMSTYRSYGGS